MNLRDQILTFVPQNEQEQRDKQELLAWLDSGIDIYSRRCNAAHLTASAWVVSPDREKVLMAYHNLYNSWAWLGGHADGMEDLQAVAAKEVGEESGLTELTPLGNGIFSLEILTVDGHEKHGRYVPSHLHLNVTYLLEAEEDQPLRVCEAENSGVAWFSLADALSASTEPWFVERIYKKLNEKLNSI